MKFYGCIVYADDILINVGFSDAITEYVRIFVSSSVMLTMYHLTLTSLLV